MKKKARRGVLSFFKRSRTDNSAAELAKNFKLQEVETPFGWSIGLDDALILVTGAERFLQHGKVAYLEFGYGLSTRILEQYFTSNFKSFSMISLEGDARYHREALKWRESRILNAGHSVDVIHVPYDDSTGLFETQPVELLINQNTPDLVFVDAPPDTNTVDARLSTIRSILPMLSRKAIVVIHDAKRLDELYAFNFLRDCFLDSAFYDTSKGIAVLRFPKGNA